MISPRMINHQKEALPSTGMDDVRIMVGVTSPDHHHRRPLPAPRQYHDRSATSDNSTDSIRTTGAMAASQISSSDDEENDLTMPGKGDEDSCASRTTSDDDKEETATSTSEQLRDHHQAPYQGEDDSSYSWQEDLLYLSPAPKQLNTQSMVAPSSLPFDKLYESATDEELSVLTQDIPDMIEFHFEASPQATPKKKPKRTTNFNPTPSIQFLSPKEQDVRKDYWYSRNDFQSIKRREKQVQQIVSKHDLLQQQQKMLKQQQLELMKQQFLLQSPPPSIPQTPKAPSGPKLEGIETDAEAKQRRLRIQVTRAAVLLLQKQQGDLGTETESNNNKDYVTQTCKVAKEASETEAHKKALFLARHVRLGDDNPEKLSAKYYTKCFTRAVPEPSLEKLKKSNSAGDIGRLKKNKNRPLARWGGGNSNGDLKNSSGHQREKDALPRTTSDPALQRPRRRRSSMEDEELGFVRRAPRRMLSSEKQKLYGGNDGEGPPPPRKQEQEESIVTEVKLKDHSEPSVKTGMMMRMPQRRKSKEMAKDDIAMLRPPQRQKSNEMLSVPGRPPVHGRNIMAEEERSDCDEDVLGAAAAASAFHSASMLRSASSPTVVAPTRIQDAVSNQGTQERRSARRRGSIVMEKSPVDLSNARW